MRSKTPHRPGGKARGAGKPRAAHDATGERGLDARGPGTRGPGAKGGGFPAPAGAHRSPRPGADTVRPKAPRHAVPKHDDRDPPRSVPQKPRADPRADPRPGPHPGPHPGPRASPPPREPRPERSLTDPAARAGLWLHGQHAVAAALANPARRLRRLLLTEEAEAALAARVPQPWPLAAERADRARLDRLLGADAAHGGVALLADPLAPPVLAAVLERPGPALVLDQVTDPRNIGAVLRSAAAFGAACVITQDRNAPEETGALAKAASGALEAVPLLRAVNLARTLAALKAAGLWVVGLDAGGPPLRGPALAGRRVALVLGAEGAGLRRLTRETCDELAGLAMPGAFRGLDSLNVSAAATVALYELSRTP